MIECFINLAENPAVVRAVINQVVAAVLLKYQAGDHICVTEQFIMCLILNADLKTVLEIITATAVRVPIDVMFQVEIWRAVDAHQDIKSQVIILDLHGSHIGISNNMDHRNPFWHKEVRGPRLKFVILGDNVVHSGVEVHGIYIARNPLTAQCDFQIRYIFRRGHDVEQCAVVSGGLQFKFQRRSKNAGGLAKTGMRRISTSRNIDEEVVLCIAAVVVIIAQGMGTSSLFLV